MRSIKFIFLILFLLVNRPVNTQEIWSLHKCILYAIENNIVIKQHELQLEQSNNNLKKAKSFLLPDLNALANQDFRFGRSVDPLTYEFTNKNNRGSYFQLGSVVNLFNGLQSVNTIAKNKIDLKKNLEELNKAKNDLSLNITRAYLEILFNIELKDIALKQCDVSSQQLVLTQELLDAGTLTKGNLLEVKAQLSADELVLVNAENQLDMSYLELAQMLDLKSTDNFEIEIPVLIDLSDESIVYNVRDIYESAVNSLPRIKSAEFSLLSARKELAIVKGERSPVLSMGGSLSTGYSNNILIPGTDNPMSFADQMDFSQNKSFGFSLRIPIFNRFSTKFNISNSEINLRQNEYFLQIEKNILFKEIQQSLTDAIAALKKYKASVTTVQSLE